MKSTNLHSQASPHSSSPRQAGSGPVSLAESMQVTSLILFWKSKTFRRKLKKNIPRIGKLPYGAKWGFIERKALLKERLYWKKGTIERKALLKERVNWNKFQNLVQIPKFGPSSKIWSKFWNLAKYLKFCQKCEILWKFWNLVEILKFGWHSEIWLKFWNLVEILKFGQNSEIVKLCQNSEIWSKFWNFDEILKCG